MNGGAVETWGGDEDEWDPTSAPAPALRFPDLERWIEGWLVLVVRRREGNGMHWCASWWKHPEATSRLGAMWAAWEQAEAEGGAALSRWWLYDFDGHWPVLTGASGPFAACTPEHHHAQQPPVLAVEAVPA